MTRARLALALLALALIAARNPRLRAVSGPSPPDLTLDGVRASLAAGRGAPGLDDAARATLDDVYGRALARLVEVERSAAAAAEHEAVRTGAPVRLAAIRSELAESADVPAAQPPPNAALRDLESALSTARTDLAGEREAQAELEREFLGRTERRTALPPLVTEARRRLDAATEAWRHSVARAEDGELGAAAVTLAAAERQAVARELEALERELESYDARGELLAARRDLAARFVARAEKLVLDWQRLVEDRRRTDVADAERAAEAAVATAARVDPVVGEVAARNAALARERGELARRLESYARGEAEANHRLERVRKDALDARSRIDAAGLTEAVGLLLRERRATLPPLRELERLARTRRSEISDVLYHRIEREAERSTLVDDFDRAVADALATFDEQRPAEERGRIEAAVRELLAVRRDVLRDVLEDYERTFTALVHLDGVEREAHAAVEEFATFVDERVLWIRSAPPFWGVPVRAVAEAAAWLATGDHWADAGRTLAREVGKAPQLALAGCVLLALAASRRRMRRALELAGEEASRALTVHMAPTFRALALTVGIAAPLPVLLWLAGHTLATVAPGPDAFVPAVGSGFAMAGWMLLASGVLRQVCRLNGLGEAHFRWPAATLRKFRAAVAGATFALAPGAWLVKTLVTRDELVRNDAWHASLGRLTFVAGMLTLAVFLARLLHPQSGLLAPRVAPAATALARSVGTARYLAGAGTPLALAGLALGGYYLTALALVTRLWATLALGFGLLLAKDLALRWLLLARRGIAIERARERRRAAARESERGELAADPEAGALSAVEPALDLATIDVQTRALLRSALVVGALVGGWLIWVDVLPALGVLRRVEIWAPSATEATVAAPTAPAPVVVGAPPRKPAVAAPVQHPARRAVTLADVVLASLVALTTVLGARNVPAFLEISVLRQLAVQPGERYAITTIARYGITLVGLVAAFRIIGVGWSQVQWLAAAVTVGLGFGLQEIFANLVSGLILLFERPMQVGDVVTIGGVEGVVTKIQTRATTITDWEQRDLVVPNREFITGRFVNATRSEAATRLVVPVAVARATDVGKACEALVRVALRTPNVLAEPAPAVTFTSFGESGLDLRLKVAIAAREQRGSATHDLHAGILDELRREGIQLALPQRDVRVHLDPPS